MKLPTTVSDLELTPVGSYLLNNVLYSHGIDLSTDTVYVFDEQLNVVMAILYDCTILLPGAEAQFGKWYIKTPENTWYLAFAKNHPLMKDHLNYYFYTEKRDLIEAEIKFAKHYLQNKEKYQ